MCFLCCLIAGWKERQNGYIKQWNATTSTPSAVLTLVSWHRTIDYLLQCQCVVNCTYLHIGSIRVVFPPPFADPWPSPAAPDYFVTVGIIPQVPTLEVLVMTNGASEPNREEAMRRTVKTGHAITTNLTNSTIYRDGAPVSIIYQAIFAVAATRPLSSPPPLSSPAPPPRPPAASDPLDPAPPPQPGNVFTGDTPAQQQQQPPPGPFRPQPPPPPLSLLPAPATSTAVGVHGTQFFWEQLLVERMPLSEIAIYAKISRLYSREADWASFDPDTDDWTKEYVRTGTYTYTARFGNLVRPRCRGSKRQCTSGSSLISL